MFLWSLKFKKCRTDYGGKKETGDFRYYPFSLLGMSTHDEMLRNSLFVRMQLHNFVVNINVLLTRN